MALLRSTPVSPYYPRRARWYSFLFWRVDRLIWRFNLDPGPSWEREWPSGVAAFFVPGFAFYLRGPTWLGRAALAACALLFAVFVVFLGTSVAGLAGAALLSIHASGVLHRCRWLLAKPLWYRVAASVATTLFLLVFLYLPLRVRIERYVARPLLFHGHPLVVHGAWFKQNVQKGEWIVYEIDTFSGRGGAYIERDFGSSALDIAPIIAAPGDRVEFSGDSLRVNGEPQPPIALVRLDRTLVVPRGCWLVRPSVQAAMTHRAVMGEREAEALLYNALVKEDRIVGQPFQSWFGRKPILR